MKKCILALLVLSAFSASALADPFSIMIGDNDGYGAWNVPDNGYLPGNPQYLVPVDLRDAAEAAATNGAQFTDAYGAVGTPGYSVNPTEVGTVTFTLPNDIISATLEIDMADFQAGQYNLGQSAVYYNGVLQPDLWNITDGYRVTRVRQFALDATAIANANAAGEFVLTFDHTGSGDYIALDYFQLSGEMVPVPGAVLLGMIGLSIAGVKLRKRA